jgi:hypothetical protein
MDRRQSQKLAEALSEQGARVRRIKAGGFLVMTDLGNVTWHETPSDFRAARNTRAAVERIGLEWPSGVSLE